MTVYQRDAKLWHGVLADVVVECMLVNGLHVLHRFLHACVVVLKSNVKTVDLILLLSILLEHDKGCCKHHKHRQNTKVYAATYAYVRE